MPKQSVTCISRCVHLVLLGSLTGFLLVPVQTGSPFLDVCLLAVTFVADARLLITLP